MTALIRESVPQLVCEPRMTLCVNGAQIGHVTRIQQMLREAEQLAVSEPRRVLIVGDSGGELHDFMRCEMQGHGFEVISVDEVRLREFGLAGHFEKYAGTFATRPAELDRNRLTAADRERAAWNEAVDQRNAEKRMHRLSRAWGDQ